MVWCGCMCWLSELAFFYLNAMIRSPPAYSRKGFDKVYSLSFIVFSHNNFIRNKTLRVISCFFETINAHCTLKLLV